MITFRIGITPDFYTEAKGKFEGVLEEQSRGVAGVESAPMPPQPGKVATPEALNQFDAIFWLSLKLTAESLKGVDRLAAVARWGVGYDMIDTDALTEAGVVLCITPNAVRRPVAEAILTLVFALLKNLPEHDSLARAGKWRGDLTRLGRNIPGHTLGSVGCGNIARELFRLARPLGFSRLLAADPYVKQEQVADLGVEMVDIDTLFREYAVEQGYARPDRQEAVRPDEADGLLHQPGSRTNRAARPAGRRVAREADRRRWNRCLPGRATAKG